MGVATWLYGTPYKFLKYSCCSLDTRVNKFCEHMYCIDAEYMH